MTNIFSTIRQEINDFIDNPIYPVEGYSFSQYDTIKRIHLYENSQFSTGLRGGSTSNPLDQLIDLETDDRVFYNICNPRRDAVKRFIDVDLKDITLEEINPLAERPIMLLNEDFYRYGNRVNLSRRFDELNHIRTTFGSTVIKINKGEKPIAVDLRRLFLDPTVKSITDSRFVTLKHMMTPNELRSKSQDGWNKDVIERIIKQASEKSEAAESYEDDGNVNQIVSSKYIEVYERYGFVEKSFLKNGSSDKEVMSLCIVGEPFNMITKQDSQGKDVTMEGGGVFFKGAWKKDLPFRDSHFAKTPGRWLGLGVFEVLFTAQERMNELANQKRISMQISALHLFQTSDPTVLNNILTDLENGDVLRTKVQGAIAPIVNEERNLPAFNVEDASYQRLADSLSAANDLVTGADVPSSTPATNVVIQNNNLISIHLNNRKEFTNFLSHYIEDFVVPELIENVSQEHYLAIAADAEDIIGIDKTIVDLKFRDKVMGMDLENPDLTLLIDPEGSRQEIMRELKESGSKRFVKIYQDYYKEKLDDVICHIDNEKKDIAKIANNTFQFYQVIASNPEAFNNPINKLLLTNYARDIGIDTSKLEVAFAKAEAQQQQVAEEQKAQRVPKVEPQPTEGEEELAKVL